VPDTGSLPLQAPLAVHAVAFVEDQVRIETEPTVPELGVAVSVTVGAGVAAAATSKSTVALAVLTPLQLKVYASSPRVLEVTLSVPDVASLPLQAPLAVQLLAFAVDQVSKACCPGAIVPGLIPRESEVDPDAGVVTENCVLTPPMLRVASVVAQLLADAVACTVT
jgi:hypothetical protein